MVDRVQAIKWESVGQGGSQEDSVPTEIDYNEDGLDMRSAFLQSDTSEDKAVNVSRDASNNMTFEDPVVGSVKTLTEVLAGDFNVDEIVLDKNSAFVTDGNGNLVMGN